MHIKRIASILNLQRKSAGGVIGKSRLTADGVRRGLCRSLRTHAPRLGGGHAAQVPSCIASVAFQTLSHAGEHESGPAQG